MYTFVHSYFQKFVHFYIDINKYEDLTNKNSFEWWLRSPPYYGSDMFCAIGIKGGMGAGQTSVHLSVAPGFCI